MAPLEPKVMQIICREKDLDNVKHKCFIPEGTFDDLKGHKLLMSNRILKWSARTCNSSSLIFKISVKTSIASIFSKSQKGALKLMSNTLRAEVFNSPCNVAQL